MSIIACNEYKELKNNKQDREWLEKSFSPYYIYNSYQKICQEQI